MTTTTKTTVKALPWLRYSADVDRQLTAGLAREAARGPRIHIPSTGTYRDQSGDYTVGYGAERSYQAPVNGASDKQKDLIDKLLVEKEHIVFTDDAIEEIKADWRKTRKLIDLLLAAPRVKVQPKVEVPAEVPARARLDFASITDGNYALHGEGAEIKFYRVSTSRNGFKKVQVRASDALFPIDNTRVSVAILHKIVEFGLAESQMLFATKLERCWKCGRSLTDQVSRERGMGDECASK